MIAAVAPSQRCLAFLLPDAVERSFGARLTGGVLFALAGLPVGLPTSSQHEQGKKERHSVICGAGNRLAQGGAARAFLLYVRFFYVVDDLFIFLEVLEVDFLWPRWVARIGVTRARRRVF